MSIGKAANDNVVPAYGPFPPTMAIAKALGSKYYFTGKPCINGHVVARYAHGSCTACKAEKREANRESAVAYGVAWRQRQTERPRVSERQMESRKSYYIQNRVEIIAKTTAWRVANPEILKETTKIWVEANKRLIKQKGKIRYDNRSEADRERAAISQRKVRANRVAAEGTHSLDDVLRILERQGHRCAECNISTLVSGYHVDHVMPLKLGGSNWPSNLQILCPRCNMEKHATDPFVFAQRKGRLL